MGVSARLTSSTMWGLGLITDQSVVVCETN